MRSWTILRNGITGIVVAQETPPTNGNWVEVPKTVIPEQINDNGVWRDATQEEKYAAGYRRYVSLLNNVVDGVVECIDPPDGWLEAPAWVSVRDLYDGEEFSRYEAPPPVANLRLTKRAFQNRFPVNPDGMSRKYDLMSMFLTKDAYAASLIADATARFGLQLLIQTGLNRLEASPYINLAIPDAANFTGLLLQPSIPAEFRLTVGERNAILSQTIATDELYVG